MRPVCCDQLLRLFRRDWGAAYGELDANPRDGMMKPNPSGAPRRTRMQRNSFGALHASVCHDKFDGTRWPSDIWLLRKKVECSFQVRPCGTLFAEQYC